MNLWQKFRTWASTKRCAHCAGMFKRSELRRYWAGWGRGGDLCAPCAEKLWNLEVQGQEEHELRKEVQLAKRRLLAQTIAQQELASGTDPYRGQNGK
jgi:hypothetical protein